MFIYFRSKERQSVSMGGAEREGDTESKAGSRIQAVSTELNTGHELTNREIMTCAKIGRSTDWATQVSLGSLFFSRLSSETQKIWDGSCPAAFLSTHIVRWENRHIFAILNIEREGYLTAALRGNYTNPLISCRCNPPTTFSVLQIGRRHQCLCLLIDSNFRR